MSPEPVFCVGQRAFEFELLVRLVLGVAGVYATWASLGAARARLQARRARRKR